MIPMLKISQIGSILVSILVIFITSGATYPGVPHRTNKYFSLLESYESPKSAILTELSFIKIFSGLRSRWITPYFAS